MLSLQNAFFIAFGRTWAPSGESKKITSLFKGEIN
jgi:hypothetical protein